MGCGRRSLRVTTLSWGWVIRPLGSCSCLGLEPRSKSILPLKETVFSVHSIHGKGGQETLRPKVRRPIGIFHALLKQIRAMTSMEETVFLLFFLSFVGFAVYWLFLIMR